MSVMQERAIGDATPEGKTLKQEPSSHAEQPAAKRLKVKPEVKAEDSECKPDDVSMDTSTDAATTPTSTTTTAAAPKAKPRHKDDEAAQHKDKEEAEQQAVPARRGITLDTTLRWEIRGGGGRGRGNRNQGKKRADLDPVVPVTDANLLGPVKVRSSAS